MTGLIYVGIIAVWAIVLVPAWLRRHDHLNPERSVEDFSRRMRTLAEPSGVTGETMPDAHSGTWVSFEPAAPEVLRVSRPEIARASARLSGMATQTGARVRGSSAALRRRIVLGVLFAALAVVGGLVAAGVLLPIALAIPATLLVAFVAVARHQVRSARSRRARPAAATSSPRPAASTTAPRRTETYAAGGTWEARPTPLPSYVTAPPASEFPRVIDTTTPGAWTAAAMLERAQQEKVRAERMAAAKAEAIARAKAEQAAAEARSRDEEYLATEAAQWQPRRRAVNE